MHFVSPYCAIANCSQLFTTLPQCCDKGLCFDKLDFVSTNLGFVSTNLGFVHITLL